MGELLRTPLRANLRLNKQRREISRDTARLRSEKLCTVFQAL
jgi:hypothetical protein